MFELQQWLLLQDSNKIGELKNSADLDSIDPSLIDLAKLVSDCDWNAVFDHPSAQQLLHPSLDATSAITSILSTISSNAEYDRTAFQISLVGIAALGAFVQLNWTGPELQLNENNPLANPSLNTKEILSNLFVEGSDGIYEALRKPELLVFARSILTYPYSVSNKMFSLCWWAARCLVVHQTMLNDKAPSIKMAIKRYFAEVEEYFAVHKGVHSDLLAEFHVEQGLHYFFFREMSKAIDHFQQARNATGLSIEISGALGKRTKFQTFDTSQLIVRAESATGEEVIKASAGEVDADSLVLKATRFTEPQVLGKSLTLVDQTILLAILCGIKGSSSTGDFLSAEEQRAFLQRIGLESKNWLVHSTYLLNNARLELLSSKTLDRALLQLQSLVDQYFDKEPSVKERMNYVYSLSYPPCHLLKKELGLSYLRIGLASSARVIFEELFMWEDLIRSFIILDENIKATELTKSRLEIHPTPELWCLLAELEDKEEHFITAWEISGNRFAKAQRLLGFMRVKKKNYLGAIVPLRTSLEINTLYPRAWFSLGCCHLKNQQWEEAARAFTSCVQQEPEDGEAWSNLSAALQKMGKLPEAFNAVQQGLKECQTNWRMWENGLILSLNVGDFSFAIQAVSKLLELRSHEFDLYWVDILAKYVCKQLDSGDKSRPILFQRDQILELLAKVSGILSGNPKVWDLYAAVHISSENFVEALDCRQKQVRQLTKEISSLTTAEFADLAESYMALGELHIKLSAKRAVHSAVLQLRSFVKKTEDIFGSHERHAQLQDLLERLKSREQEL